jgi:hypothetical protein
MMNPIGDPLFLLSMFFALNFVYLKNKKASWKAKKPLRGLLSWLFGNTLS